MVIRLKHRVIHALGVVSKIWFWFLIVMIAYSFITFYDSLGTKHTKHLWWSDFYDISSAFLVGGLVSFMFYFLVVYIPERKKRHIIKTNLMKLYADTKQAILYQIIFASQKGGRNDLSANTETVEQLLTVGGFRSAFKDGHESHEGFYAFCNGISGDASEYQEIILNLSLLSKQIDFVLHNYPIIDAKIFDFFKRLEISHSIRKNGHRL